MRRHLSNYNIVIPYVKRTEKVKNNYLFIAQEYQVIKKKKLLYNFLNYHLNSVLTNITILNNNFSHFSNFGSFYY